MTSTRTRIPAPVDVLTGIGRSRALRPLHHPVGLLLPHLLGALSNETIAKLVGFAGRRVGAPFCGALATRISDSTIKQNLLSGQTMFETIERAVTTWRLDGDFTFSDLTVEPEACGCEIEMPEDSLPYVLTNPVQSVEDLHSLRIPDPYRDGRMPVFVECVRLLSNRFTLLTIAGGSGPFTLAAELMGASQAAIATAKQPDLLEELLEYCLEVNTRYLGALTKAGAEVIAIAEPTGAILSAASFRRFSGRYIARLVEKLDRPVILHICGSTTHLIEEMCATGALGISIDGSVDLRDAAERVPRGTLIVGNLDTVEVFLEMDSQDVRTATLDMLSTMRGVPAYVAASGCDLSPQTPVENIQAFVEAVRSFR